MDFATIIGITGAFIVVLLAMMLGGGVLMFINVPSILIVLGGTTLIVMSKWSFEKFLGAIKIFVVACKDRNQSIEEILENCNAMAVAARKGGVLSLEDFKVENSVLKDGVQLLLDGHDAEVVRTMMSKDMNQMLERHMEGQQIFRGTAETAPAMGMIGTLVGLVQMLSAMDDPSNIGPAMAVALLTTLYGALIANVMFTPMADKLELRSNEERRIRLLIMDALGAIQAGQNPRVIADVLKAYLPPSKRALDGASEAKEEG